MLPSEKTIRAWLTMRNGKYRLITAREATNQEKVEYHNHVKSILGLH